MEAVRIATKANLLAAEEYLASVDPILGAQIKAHGHCDLIPHHDYYGALVDSIISQQLSIKAAETISGRLRGLFDDRLPTPEQIMLKSHEDLRAVGLSNSKVSYIRDLADKLLDNTLDLARIEDLSDDQLIKQLTAVKGIGVWTSHMFLIFCVGRLDVLPVGDLGIRKGLKNLYGLKLLPRADKVTKIYHQHRWSPYGSVASWYIWRSQDTTAERRHLQKVTDLSMLYQSVNVKRLTIHDMI